MNDILLSTEYVLVLDTNSPAYDFLYDLCAYCTGFEAENSNCYLMIEKYYESLGLKNKSLKERLEGNPFRDIILDKMDEYGFLSPCSIWLNKKYGFNELGNYDILNQDNFEIYPLPAPLSVGIFFEKEPNQEQIDAIKKRAEEFFQNEWKNPVKIENIRIIKKTLYGSEKMIY